MAKTKTGAVDEQIVRANTLSRDERPAPTFTSLYVNDIVVMTTPWDIRLRMGQIESVDVEQNAAVITVLADVRLSPQHAKKLVAILAKQLEEYEARMGPIPQPPESNQEPVA